MQLELPAIYTREMKEIFRSNKNIYLQLGDWKRINFRIREINPFAVDKNTGRIENISVDLVASDLKEIPVKKESVFYWIKRDEDSDWEIAKLLPELLDGQRIWRTMDDDLYLESKLEEIGVEIIHG